MPDLEVSQPFTGATGFQYVGTQGGGTSQLAIASGTRSAVLVGDAAVGRTGKLTVVSKTQEDLGAFVTDGGASNIVLQTLPGGNSGFQAINFNGCYGPAAEEVFVAGKLRWRIAVDQRIASDHLIVDVYDGTTKTLKQLLSVRYVDGKAQVEIAGDLKVTGKITAAGITAP
ncbi:MAG TPA: hypothetical protein VF824_04000 [Thermoanaerobaculia bacterium]|jgi:hypothetical protein